MRNTLLLIAFLVYLTSCSSSKHTSSSSIPSSSSPSSSSDKDGSSYDQAIVIKEKREGPGVDAEYVILAKTYAGYELISQSLVHNNGKAYDLMKIKLSNGEVKTIYFDITNFFGKF